jgi:hypothetical protein
LFPAAGSAGWVLLGAGVWLRSLLGSAGDAPLDWAQATPPVAAKINAAARPAIGFNFFTGYFLFSV